MATIGQEHGVADEPAHRGTSSGDLPLSGQGAHLGVCDGRPVGLDVDGSGHIAVQRIVAVEEPPVHHRIAVLGLDLLRAARPFQDGDVTLTVADDESGRYLPACPGEFGVEAQTAAGLGQDTQQLVAQDQHDGEIGLDIGLMLRGRRTLIDTRGAVMTEARDETGGGTGWPLENQTAPAGQAPVALLIDPWDMLWDTVHPLVLRVISDRHEPVVWRLSTEDVLTRVMRVPWAAAASAATVLTLATVAWWPLWILAATVPAGLGAMAYAVLRRNRPVISRAAPMLSALALIRP